MPIDLVTGGSGFIGRHLVATLRGRGAQVRILDLAPPDDLEADVEFVPGSILDPQRLDAAMADVRRVYHLAGIAKLWTRDKSDFERINAGGTATVLRAAAAHRVERVVHCSTEAILLPKRGGADAPIDETVQPDLADMPGPYTRSKLMAEQSVLAAVQGGLDALIVNPTVPIGPDDRNLTPPAAMLSMFLNGQSPAYLDCVLNLVDVRDVAAAWCSRRSAAAPANAIFSAATTSRCATSWACWNAYRVDRCRSARCPDGWRSPRRPLTEWVADSLTGRTPAATREGVRLALRSGAFDSRKARSELGYAPRPLEDALRDAVTWLSSVGASAK